MAWLGFVLLLATPPAVLAESPVDWVAAGRESAAILAEYVRIDTANPPGDVSRAADYLTGLARKEGISVRRYVSDEKTGRVNMVVRLPGRGAGKPLLMLSHMDVVPVEPARWKLSPFSAAVEDGEMWGRGTLDMKGMGVMQLMTMFLLKRQGAILGRDLLLLFTADEEIGGELGAGWMVKNHWRDLDPEYVLDEGAAGSRGIYTDDGRVVFGVSVAEKKVLWMKIRTQGDSGHGSMPGKRQAVAKLAEIVARVQGLQPEPRDTAIVADMRKRLGRLADNAITRALARTTITVTSLRAGVGDPPKVNVIPGEAEATIDCRLLPEDSVSEMIGRVRDLCGDPDVSLEIVMRPEESAPQAHESPLFSAIVAAVTEHVPGAVTVPVLLAGGTDARYFRARGVKAYGFEPMLRSVEEEELIHGDNERIRLAELDRGTRIYYGMVREFLAPR